MSMSFLMSDCQNAYAALLVKSIGGLHPFASTPETGGK